MPVQQSATEWYFAYGSNLDPLTFCGRRRMQPLETRSARLEDFSLRFDLPVGPSNRGVANVVAQTGAAVWGVAYRITPADGRRLDRSEGVARDYYRRTPVTLHTAGNTLITAFTYTSARGRNGRLPSARYLGLLVTGARYHQLPRAWIEHLEGWPMAHDERTRQQGQLF